MGSTQHLAAQLFEVVTGIDVLVVPYMGSPADEGLRLVVHPVCRYPQGSVVRGQLDGQPT